MGIDFPSSLTASTGQKFTYSGQEYEFNGTAWRKVKDRVTSFNGATGAIIGVTSVQGKTGDVTLTDLEITHGVETFNGLSGSIDTTSLTLPVAGISASSGITSHGGLANISSTKAFRIGQPGLGFGGGPFDPLTYSFPTEPSAADSDGKNPQILIQNTALVPNTGNMPLSFAKIGDFTVNSFNGLTADVDTTSLVLPVTGLSASGGITLSGDLFVGGKINAAAGISMDTAGITFADGTFQKTAAKSGYRYVIDQVGSGALSSTPSAGTIDVTQQFVGLIDKISIHDTDADGNDISSLLTLFADSGGYLQVMTADNLELFVAHISSADLEDNNLTHTFGSDVFVLQHTSDGIEMIGLDTFESGDEVFVTIVPAAPLVSSITDSTRGTGTDAIRGNIFVDGTPVNSGGLSASHYTNFNRLFIDDEVKLNLKGVTLGTGHLGFNDGTLQQTATKDVGTFTISASSAISTGAKADALHRIPYNATLTKFELKSKATGGMTAAVYIAGGDFGDPTTGFVTGATAETTGFTADTTTFGTATVSEGDFVYLHVLANASGATAAQAFVSYETRA